MAVSLVLFLLCLISVQGQGLDRIRVDGDNHWFLDSEGRVVIFHGVNNVYKGFPWYSESLFNDTLLQDLEDWGFNLIRMGSMWTGAEPVQDEFNETYIEILVNATERLESRGIYTLLDMHQDVFSSYYESYDGVPPWLVEQFPPPTNPYPWPLDEVIYWEQGYLTQACSEGFQSFYNNTADAIYEWADFWVKMAETFKDNPAVVGYEYMNEPWIGDYFSSPALGAPGYAGEVNLMPAYDIVTERLREVDPDQGIVFFEPMIYGQADDGDYLGSGFDHVPGGDQYRDLSAYSWHAYCWFLEFVGSNATDEERLDAIDRCKTGLVPGMFSAAEYTTNITGGASILTEFGLCAGYQETEIPYFLCETYVEIADQFFESWTMWHWPSDWYDGNGNRIYDSILPHVRPYARRTAGIPQIMTFDPETLDFHFEYKVDFDISAPTEIFVPAARYTEGYEVSVTNGNYTKDGNLLFVSGLPDSGETLVQVDVSAS